MVMNRLGTNECPLYNAIPYQPLALHAFRDAHAHAATERRMGEVDFAVVLHTSIHIYLCSYHLYTTFTPWCLLPRVEEWPCKEG